jgi:prolipoprotein diacylglyceryltransferase
MNLAIFSMGPFELLLIALFLGMFAFWLWMLVDCVTKEEDQNQKLIWVIIIVLTGIVGAPLYFFIRKLPRNSRLK